MAQSVEQLICNQQVVSSSLTFSSIGHKTSITYLFLCVHSFNSGVKRLNGTPAKIENVLCASLYIGGKNYNVFVKKINITRMILFYFYDVQNKTFLKRFFRDADMRIGLFTTASGETGETHKT